MFQLLSQTNQDPLLFLDQNRIYTDVFILCKFVELYTFVVCILLSVSFTLQYIYKNVKDFKPKMQRLIFWINLF